MMRSHARSPICGYLGLSVEGSRAASAADRDLNASRSFSELNRYCRRITNLCRLKMSMEGLRDELVLYLARNVSAPDMRDGRVRRIRIVRFDDSGSGGEL